MARTGIRNSFCFRHLKLLKPFVISVSKHNQQTFMLAALLAELRQAYIAALIHNAGTRLIWGRMAGGFSAALMSRIDKRPWTWQWNLSRLTNHWRGVGRLRGSPSPERHHEARENYRPWRDTHDRRGANVTLCPRRQWLSPATGSALIFDLHVRHFSVNGQLA